MPSLCRHMLHEKSSNRLLETLQATPRECQTRVGKCPNRLGELLGKACRILDTCGEMPKQSLITTNPQKISLTI
jgi:hypothetical protein